MPGGDVEPTAHPTRLHDAIKNDRLRHALELARAAVLDHEQARHESLRGSGDQHGVRLRRALDARRDVRGFAEDLIAISDHYQPGVHANSHRQAYSSSRLVCRV